MRLSKHPLVLALGLALLPAAPALAAYECINDEVTGTSGREARTSVAEREAKRDWEAKAKAKHGANFRWMMAYKLGNQPSYRMNGAFYIGTARAYPCRLKTLDSMGQFLHAQTEAERACQDRPGFETAQKYGCKLFYLRGN
jgi:hypothetical protein